MTERSDAINKLRAEGKSDSYIKRYLRGWDMVRDTENLFTVDPDQPVNCPICGARTEFTEFVRKGVDLQEHKCLNVNCEMNTDLFYTEFGE